MLGVYFHIPYCLQRCTYCDFATYEKSQILPPEDYVRLVKEEMFQKISSSSLRNRTIDTVYFGGGTPSLIPAELIISLLEELEKYGMRKRPDAEVTIEINPATVDTTKMNLYLKAGINRFSVGAQTFDDSLLKSVHREHNAQQTRETLRLLKSLDVNYSFDLLFALPGQNIDILKKDLAEVLTFSPPHVSPYCLTVPEGHILAKTRPLEDTQLQMFELISQTLLSNGYHQYEISNFAKKGFESKHNSLYWNDSEYISFGLSAHSYLHDNKWGVRFWNASSIGAYEQQILALKGQALETPYSRMPSTHYENLKANQALTDYCHTFLRTAQGLELKSLESKFDSKLKKAVEGILLDLKERGWVNNHQTRWFLTSSGLVLSNQVFAALTFLEDEINS